MRLYICIVQVALEGNASKEFYICIFIFLLGMTLYYWPTCMIIWMMLVLLTMWWRSYLICHLLAILVMHVIDFMKFVWMFTLVTLRLYLSVNGIKGYYSCIKPCITKGLVYLYIAQVVLERTFICICICRAWHCSIDLLVWWYAWCWS